MTLKVNWTVDPQVARSSLPVPNIMDRRYLISALMFAVTILAAQIGR